MSVVRMWARRPVPPDAPVVARLHDTARWPTWLVGCRAVAPHPDGIAVRFGGPVPFGCVLGVTPRRDGIDVSLVTGDVAAVRGSIALDGEHVGLDVVVAFPIDLPTGLARELATPLPMRWLRGLCGTPALRGSGPDAG